MFLLGKDLNSFREIAEGPAQRQPGTAPARHQGCADQGAPAPADQAVRGDARAGQRDSRQPARSGHGARSAGRRSWPTANRCARAWRRCRTSWASEAGIRMQPPVGDAAVGAAAWWSAASASCGCSCRTRRSVRRPPKRSAQEAERQEQEAKRVNDANQAAILRLMNELQTVAEGDLTQQATVTEDITGAIADSVNYTVEELRTLVAQVQGTAGRVTETTQQVEATSTELLAASTEQLREIRETGESVLQMAGRINAGVGAGAGNRPGGAPVAAGRRVGPAGGAEHHRRHELDPRPDPGNLQADQAAGRIVAGDRRNHRADLGHYRADQRAGAERRHPGGVAPAKPAAASRWWPKKCSDWPNARATPRGRSRRWCKTIQTDTQDAVAAMERSTQGVVEGARLSDAAGTRAGRHRPSHAPAGRADRAHLRRRPPAKPNRPTWWRRTSSTSSR